MAVGSSSYLDLDHTVGHENVVECGAAEIWAEIIVASYENAIKLERNMTDVIMKLTRLAT